LQQWNVAKFAQQGIIPSYQFCVGAIMFELTSESVVFPGVAVLLLIVCFNVHGGGQCFFVSCFNFSF